MLPQFPPRIVCAERERTKIQKRGKQQRKIKTSQSDDSRVDHRKRKIDMTIELIINYGGHPFVCAVMLMTLRKELKSVEQ